MRTDAQQLWWYVSYHLWLWSSLAEKIPEKILPSSEQLRFQWGEMLAQNPKDQLSHSLFTILPSGKKKIQKFLLPHHQTAEQLFLFGLWTPELILHTPLLRRLFLWLMWFCDYLSINLQSWCHCFATLCCIMMVKITVNYVKMLLSAGPGSLKSITETL